MQRRSDARAPVTSRLGARATASSTILGSGVPRGALKDPESPAKVALLNIAAVAWFPDGLPAPDDPARGLRSDKEGTVQIAALAVARRRLCASPSPFPAVWSVPQRPAVRL